MGKCIDCAYSDRPTYEYPCDVCRDTKNGRSMYCPEEDDHIANDERKTDYITREAAIALLKKWADGYSYIETPTEDAIHEFNAVPAADVRPVVLCRDCIHFTAYSAINEDGTGMCGLCGKRPIGFIVDEYDFCSSGERRSAKMGGKE